MAATATEASLPLDDDGDAQAGDARTYGLCVPYVRVRSIWLDLWRMPGGCLALRCAGDGDGERDSRRARFLPWRFEGTALISGTSSSCGGAGVAGSLRGWGATISAPTLARTTTGGAGTGAGTARAAPTAGKTGVGVTTVSRPMWTPCLAASRMFVTVASRSSWVPTERTAAALCGPTC